MQKVIETRMEWGERFGDTKLHYPTGLGNAEIGSAYAQLWSVNPLLSIQIEFSRTRLERLEGLQHPLRKRLSGTGIKLRFAMMSCHTGDQSWDFLFPRIRGEDSCLTVFKTYLLILKLLEVENLEIIAHTAPVITQETYWRESGEKGEWRATWVSHGEYLVSKMRVPA